MNNPHPDQSTTITASALQSFKADIECEFHAEGDTGYDEARKVWNGMIDRKPAIIVQCYNHNDVMYAVKFAAKNNLVVSIHGGGHNVAGNAVCEGGVMINLSKMKAIQIDPGTRRAFVEPGVIWKELDKATQEYGLATTGGTVSDTGIAGLTLGGGLGWLMCKYGLSCDNLLSAEMVTANGEFIKADKDNHPDLFWAIRGGGGNFGIVTKFEYQLYPVGPTVIAGMIFFPMEQAKEVFRFYREYVRTAPDELMSYAGFIVTPDGLPVTFILPAWMGKLEEGERHIAPIRAFGSPLADMIGEIPYTQLQSILDAACPTGIRRYWKSGYFKDLTDELIDVFIKHVSTRPSPLTAVLVYHIRGAAARVDPAATAFPHRRDQWDSDIISQWIDAADDETNFTWTRNFWKEIEPFTGGVYVNHLDGDDGNDRVRNAYGENYQKLQEIKRKYDPANFFRMNNNIIP